MTAGEERQARLAAQLRANLKRRKAQEREARREVAGEAADDQCAASIDPSDSAADAAR